MTTVASKASILSLGPVFMLVFGLILPCIAGGGDQPEQIIRKMYRELLRGNFAGDITSKNNRTKYLVPSLARLYDANDAADDMGKPPCIDFNILVAGQDFDANHLRKSLSIRQTSNDGTRAEIVSKPGPTDTFRYEFIKESGRWKLSDVVLPWGQRLSHTACSESAPLPVHAADVPERWLASSHTATAITGDVRFSSSKIAFENGKDLPLTPFEKASSFNDDIEGEVMADIYKVVAPADPILLNGNRLCGGIKPRPVTFIAVWKPKSGGVWMASSSSATKPKGMDDICGTYGYEPAPSFSMTGKPDVRRHFGMDAPGNDRGSWIRQVGTVDACETLCLADPGCAGYTYNTRRSTCIPKNRIGPLVRHSENPVTGVILGRAGDTAMHSEVSPAGEPGAPQKVEVKDGIYCVHPTSRNNGELADGVLAVRQESHDALEIGLLVSYPERNDAVSALGGLVKKVATNHWLYLDGMDSSNPDDHCAVDIYGPGLKRMAFNYAKSRRVH